MHGVLMAVSGLVFVLLAQETYNMRQRENEMGSGVTECTRNRARGQRWRAERNFWIAGFALALWIVLHRYQGAKAVPFPTIIGADLSRCNRAVSPPAALVRENIRLQRELRRD